MSPASGWRAAVVPPRDDGRGPLPPGTTRVVGAVLHLAFAVAATVALVQALDADASRPVLVVALAAWVLGYVLLGGRAVVHSGGRRAAVFLTVQVAVVGVLAWEQPSLLFVMWAAYPLVWFVTGALPAGILWTLLLAAAATVGPFVAWSRGDEQLWGPGETLVGMALSLLMGLWVHRLVTLSVQRDELIAELEATRDELAAAHHERGVAAERERWAREVHDTLAQGYTSIVVLAQTAAAQLPADPGAAAERVALIEEVARENLGEARAMVAAFAPVPLDSSTLVEALQRLAERFGRETGLATRLDTSALGEGASLSRAEEIVLLRGAQEALANVRRHASASAVVLRLSRVGTGPSGQVSVHVEDDGVGFDVAAAEGVGLAGLRDRAAQVGGAVDVASAPGEGTRVTVRVPGADR
ncbi:sensor histidine kinase [Modestobacter excelsi]|uniref:sensor histidine kinase n=1 Tax=Modestobacter excelsi TaxID=2213161 RepID=UPI00110C961B|nr:sensor histidine kinase [Modestobacter excelsi]